jgi:hypothetical protein
MVPAGYMAKKVSKVTKEMGLNAVDIYSVAGCISEDFTEYIKYWKHNAYWFYDSPQIIQELAKESSLDLTGTKLFYYEIYPKEYCQGIGFKDFKPNNEFQTNIVFPKSKIFEGYDVATFSCGSSAECSPLTCNGIAKNIKVNEHCLMLTLEDVVQSLTDGKFDNSEPGPFRVFAVYSLEGM